MPDPTSAQKEPVQTIDLPYIHPKVNFADLTLYGNGKLFSDAQIAAVRNHEAFKGFNGRVTKGNLNKFFEKEIAHGTLTEFKFSLEKAGDELFAIYKGKEHSLGSGSFGSVKVLQNLTTGETTEALKVLKSPDTTPEQVAAERKGLEIADQYKSSYKRAEKPNQYEIVMQLAKGNSLMHLQGKKMPTVVWIDVMIGVLQALKDLQARGVIHRDLKPDNIHYDPITKKVTIIDMGLAVQTADPVLGVQGQAVGSPLYMSPSADQGIFNEKTELHALGISFAELLQLLDFKVLTPNAAYSTPVVREVDDKSQQHVIADDETRAVILLLLQHMTDPDNNCSLTAGPGLVDVIAVLNSLREQYLDTPSLTNRVAYLNIDDVMNDQSGLDAILAELEKVDQVWLIDNGANENQYLAIHHAFTRLGINVSNTVIQYSGNNLEQTMKAYADQRENSDRNIYDCNYVSRSAQVVPLRSVMTGEQINKVIASLKEESAKLVAKQDPTVQPLVQMINDTVVRLHKEGGSLSVLKIVRELDNLQNSMLQDPEVQKNIVTIMTSLKNSIKVTPLPMATGFEAAKKLIDREQELEKLLQSIPPPPPRFQLNVTPPPLPPKPVKHVVGANNKIQPPPLPANNAAGVNNKVQPPPLPAQYAVGANNKVQPPPLPAQYAAGANNKVQPPPLPPQYAAGAKNKVQPPPLPAQYAAGANNKVQPPPLPPRKAVAANDPKPAPLLSEVAAARAGLKPVQDGKGPAANDPKAPPLLSEVQKNPALMKDAKILNRVGLYGGKDIKSPTPAAELPIEKKRGIK